MRRAIPLVIAIALAGCVGGVVPGSGGAQTAPPDTDWADENGINATALADNHFETLREAGSFTVNRSETVRVDGEARPDGPRPEGYHPPSVARKQVNLDRGRYLDSYVTVGHRRSNHFITPEVTARREKPCPDCVYEFAFQQRPEPDTRSKRIDQFRTGKPADRLAGLLRGVSVGFNYSYTGTVDRGGETLYRYRAETDLETAPPPFAEPPHGTATLLITDDGVVRRFELEYAGVATVTVDGSEQTVEVTHAFVRTYTDVGSTTVERPSWVDRAADADQPRRTATEES